MESVGSPFGELRLQPFWQQTSAASEGSIEEKHGKTLMIDGNGHECEQTVSRLELAQVVRVQLDRL